MTRDACDDEGVIPSHARVRFDDDHHHASRGARARVPVRGVHARRALVQRHDGDDEDGLEGGARAPSGTGDDDEDARRGGWG